MRKLATIAKINQIRPHPNADQLELATIRGWQVVTRKGEFQEGQLVVYCEIDSLMPERPEFEFLRERHFRIRTIKLRGELSQGICFPLSVLETPFNDGDWPALTGHDWHEMEWTDGDDVTEVLGVTLYQPPMPSCLASDVVGPFPSLIPKTDCERIQNHAWILDELAELEWVATEKLDGSSCSVMWKDGALHVCSRNWELQESDRNAFWQAARRLNLADKLRDTGIALQGELLGPGIQGNRYRMTEPSLLFFDAYDIEKQCYLDVQPYWRFCLDLELPMVPLIIQRCLPSDSMGLPELLLAAEGVSALNYQTEREGLVWRPLHERYDPRIGRVAFKTISNRFLLKQKG